MLLLKPCYGQIAPRAWYLAAVDKLKSMGLKQHPQDPCCFLMYEGELNSEFDPAAYAPHLLGPHGLCGMVIMHVDDMLGCGSTASQCYNDTIAKLKSSSTFREWKTGEDGKPLTYCGCDIHLNEDGSYMLNQKSYLGKVKRISFDRKRNLIDPFNERELTQLRGLLGSLQWPAVQSSPHLQSSASILSGHVTKARLQTVSGTNRLLRFAKEHADVGSHYAHLGPVDDLRMVCFSDAAFATRSDGSSQAGYVIMLLHKGLLETNGPEGAYHILDWRSMKTPRIAGSSLGAEAQSGGQACDALEHASVYWSLLMDPRQSLQHVSLSPVMVTDAKALLTPTTEKESPAPWSKRERRWKSQGHEGSPQRFGWQSSMDVFGTSDRRRPDQGICSAPTGSTPSTWSPQAGMGSLVQSCQEENQGRTAAEPLGKRSRGPQNPTRHGAP